jgi:hypothetical protein
MRAIPVLAAALLLAGCASAPSASDLGNRYGATNVEPLQIPDFLFGGKEGTVNMTSILGPQIEVRVGDGEFSEAAAAIVEGGAIQGPAVAGSGATGGGGDVNELPPIPAVTAEARLRDPAAAEGLTVAWVLVSDSLLADPVPAPAARLAPDATFTFQLDGPGLYHVGAFLLASEDDPVREAVAVLRDGAPVSVKAHYTATGEVHPVRMTGLGIASLPSTTEREQMVDSYTFAAPEGLPVVATTSFNGGQGDGTDVDLGLFNPQGEGVFCVGSGGGGSLAPTPDPAQAGEAIETATDAAGTWSVQVGAMQDGCSGQSGWYYANAAPVPYKLDILLG